MVRKGCGLEPEPGTGLVISGAVQMKDSPGVMDILQQLRSMGLRD